MGVVQVGLAALAKHLHIAVDPHVDDWNAIITKIEGAVTAKRRTATGPQASPRTKSNWKRIEPFYNEIISDIRAIKNAWRNPDAHFRRPFDEAQAKKVLEKVGDFMKNLADHLPRK